jgi:AraC-like DNA-binding protein
MDYLRISIPQPAEYISGGQFMSEDIWTHTKRVIDSFEIIIGVSGTLYIEQEGVKYEVTPGDMLLILPQKTHLGYRCCDKNLSFYWFHFLCSPSPKLIGEKEVKNNIISLNSQRNGSLKQEIFVPLFSKIPFIERVNILAQQLLHVDNDNYYTRMSMDYLVTLLLIEISEQTLNHFKQSQDNLIINQIMEWARINITNGITPKDIAQKFNYNKDYLSRFFKKETGICLQKHIHLLTIQKAKGLLSNSNMSIKEIAFKVGMNDEKYFMRLFKKYEKMTASEYRNGFSHTHYNNN